MKMYFEVITRMKSYYTVIFDQKHLTFSHPNRDRNSNLHVFHWIRSHVKYNYDADYMTACLFYITRFHSLPRPSRNFHKVKNEKLLQSFSFARYSHGMESSSYIVWYTEITPAIQWNCALQGSPKLDPLWTLHKGSNAGWTFVLQTNLKKTHHTLKNVKYWRGRHDLDR